MNLHPFKLCILLATLSVSLAYGQLPDGFTSYDQRPDILKVEPKNHDGVLPEVWRDSKRGHLEAVAQLLELYPEREIYFLARDSELLYDFARLATVDEPSAAKRIHLLNVSRKNMRAENIKAYLAQEGISEKALKSGKKILFVDTGFNGTISRAIEGYFPDQFRSSFQTRMILSENVRHPSMRVFLRSLTPNITRHPVYLGENIQDYEKMAHFSDRSTGFVQVKGKWVPIIPQKAKGSDGKVDPKMARQFQESLVDYQRSDEAKNLFHERRALYRKLYQLKDDPKQLKLELKALLKSDPYNKALVIDVVDTENMHFDRQSLQLKDFGIKVERPGLGKMNKVELIKKYPAWTDILDAPESEISRYLKEKKHKVLAAMNEVLDEYEHFYHFTVAMGNLKSVNKQDAALLEALIKTKKADMQIALYVLSRPSWGNRPELVKALMQNGTVDRFIVERVLSEPHWVKHPELVEAMIEKGTMNRTVLSSIVSNTHWDEHRQRILAALFNSGKADQQLADFFANDFWKNFPEFQKICPQGVTFECMKAKLQASGTQTSTPCSASQVLKTIIH